MHLDSLMLRIVEIEEGVEKSAHATDVKFKGAGKVQAEHHAAQQSPVAGQRRARSPPPPRKTESDSEEDDVNDEDENEHLGLSLTRFPSGSARQPPPLVPSDDGSSSDEDDELSNMLSGVDSELLKSITEKKGDEELANMYNTINNCPCQKNKLPVIENIWEISEEMIGKGIGVRKAVVEIRV